jgi:hypothetical protein
MHAPVVASRLAALTSTYAAGMNPRGATCDRLVPPDPKFALQLMPGPDANF